MNGGAVIASILVIGLAAFSVPAAFVYDENPAAVLASVILFGIAAFVATATYVYEEEEKKKRLDKHQDKRGDNTNTIPCPTCGSGRIKREGEH